MIKEFWQERKEERRKLKELKKQNRKHPKSKEERVYKIFGIFFSVFLIISLIVVVGNSCSGLEEYDWNKLIGLTPEMKIELQKKINRSDIITDEITVFDWSNCKDKLRVSGLDIVVDNKISETILISKSERVDSELELTKRELGALVRELIAASDFNDKVVLIQFDLYYEGEDLKLETIISLDLTAVVTSSSLPTVYVTTKSTLAILDEKLACLNSAVQLNKIEKTKNDQLVKVINDNSYVEIAYYTNMFCIRQLNSLSDNVFGKINFEDTVFKMISRV